MPQTTLEERRLRMYYYVDHRRKGTEYWVYSPVPWDADNMNRILAHLLEVWGDTYEFKLRIE